MATMYEIDEDCVPLCCMTAVYKGYDEVLKLLIEGTSTEIMDTKFNTALLVAAGQGEVEIMKLLLDRKANFNHKNFYGKTALHFACAKGQEAAVKLLLIQKANHKLRDNSKYTGLHSAVEGGNKRVASLLLEHDFSMGKRKNRLYQTALHYNARKGTLRIAEKLILYGNGLDNKCQCGRTPLHYACQTGNEDIVQFFLEEGGPSVTEKDVCDATVLHFSAEGGNKSLVELFLQKGLCALDKTLHQTTVLHHSEKSGNIKCMELLLGFDLDVNALDVGGKSALHYATEAGHEGAVRLLLKHNASISEDHRGCNMLHFAVRSQNYNLVKFFIEKNFSVNSKDTKGRTVLHVAAEIKTCDVSLVQRLLELGSSVDTQDLKGRTPLHVAARMGNEELVATLLDHGANANLLTTKNYSALNFASEHGYVKVVKLLVKRGACKFFENIFVEAYDKYDDRLIKALLNCGFNTNKVLSHNVGNIDYGPSVYFSETVSDYIRVDAKSAEIAEKLLDYGENPNDALKHLWFTLDCGRMKKFQALLDYQVNVNRYVDGKGHRSPMIKAAYIIPYASLDFGNAKVIIKQLVKMKHKNLEVEEVNWTIIQREGLFRAFHSECEIEIEKLKKAKVLKDSLYTYFDVLTSSFNRLANITKKEATVQVFKLNDYKKRFPIYHPQLHAQVRRGVWRGLLLLQADGFFAAVTSSKCRDSPLPKLPAVCLYTLYHYLSNRDLKMLIRSYKPQFEMDIHDVIV